jgi:hypothetical protein
METVAFNSIGFHAALILNRLRNEIALSSGAEQSEREQSKRTPKGKREDQPDEDRDEIKRRLRELTERQQTLAAGIKGRR